MLRKVSNKLDRLDIIYFRSKLDFALKTLNFIINYSYDKIKVDSF